MTARFLQTLFTPAVRAAQQANGAADAYSSQLNVETGRDALTPAEAAFIAERDSFYMASVTEDGWPYVQHRGGPAGFVKIVDAGTVGFADYRGNRQYVSVGNLSADNRVSLFFMDYPNRRRLKLLGRMKITGIDDAGITAPAFIDVGYKAKIERLMLIEIDAFDWNCPQHITPRFTIEEMAPTINALKARIAELEALAAVEP
jgi:predicted pyridoxine 5'-phosphate oxidase superfamily flavin-nucleotide-binding protein